MVTHILVKKRRYARSAEKLILSLRMNAKFATINFLKRKLIEYYFTFRRGLYSSLNSDNYTLYFWDMLHSDPLFSSLNKINDYVTLK